ncbi:MAG: adenylate/guanylate cyclase domain-containing protein [Hyphomicrobiales bacterium]|nr:adenylate/guanylate cyclase domain-containing protein [Hyphomicrobiales bacterium]
MRSFVFGVAISAGGIALGLSPAGTAFEENVGLSWLFQLRGPIQPPSDVVLVSLNKRSAQALDVSTLPREWPRSLYGQVIDRLVERGASLIVFDLTFETAQTLEEDAAFALAMARSKRVLLVERIERSRQPILEPDGRTSGWIWIDKIRRPSTIFANAAVGIAPFPLPKVPARVNQFWAFLRDGANTPTLPSAALQAHGLDAHPQWLRLLDQSGLKPLGATADEPRFRAWTIQVQELARVLRRAFDSDPQLHGKVGQAVNAQAFVPGPELTSAKGEGMQALLELYTGPESRYLNFYGPPGTIQTIPFDVALQALRTPAEGEGRTDFAGKFVFVGYSELFEPSKVDGFYTVFSQANGVDLSGTEIVATAFANLLTRNSIIPVSWTMTVVLLLVFGMVLAFSASYLPAAILIPSALGAAVFYAAAAQLLFNIEQIWLPLAVPLLVQWPLALFCGLMSQYLIARQQRETARNYLKYYVPESIVPQIADHPVDPVSVRETAYAACLAADAENYTSLAEGMTPDATASFLSEYFAALAGPMHHYQTDFQEFYADSALCAWKSLGPDASLREKACLAALDAVDAIAAFNARHAPLRLGIRIGLHAGTVFVGNVGAGGRYAYRLVGDTVNTTSRIESVNKPLGTRLLASTHVVAGLDTFLVRHLGEFRLKGRQNPIGIVEILGLNDSVSMAQMALCSRFARALDVFREQRWEEAAEDFSTILKDYPGDGPSRFYLNQSLACIGRAATERASGVIELSV